MRTLIIIATVAYMAVFAAVAGAGAPSGRPADALDRVERQVALGSITPKDAVLLKAKLLFDDGASFSAAESKLLGARRHVDQPCLTSFYKDVHGVYEQLTSEERDHLASLSEDLRVIMRSRVAASSGVPLGVLPDFGLDKTVEGTYCQVNYTTAGVNAVPDVKYAQAVKTSVDAAIKAETKTFRTAYAEGGGKLQVYIVKDDAWGSWIDVSDAAGTGKPKSGYIKISNKKAAGDWKTELKSTCYHEYFHGVQSAYNWKSSLWFMEGTCTWTEIYYCKNYSYLREVFGSPSSCFKKPSLPLWDKSYHKYSTVAWVYHLANQYGGAAFVKSYFEATETQDDAIVVLEGMLAGEGSTFEEQFKTYAWAMYTKNIAVIRPYMPSVKRMTLSSYGAKGQRTTLRQTGIDYFTLKPMASIPEATLLMNFVPGATGAPEAFFFSGTSSVTTPLTDSAVQGVYPEFVGSFGKKVKTVCLVVTDPGYAGEDATARTYSLDLITPRCTVTKITAQTPIVSGASSPITITYNLLGTHRGEATFPVELVLTEKGPDVSDNISGDMELAPGTKKTQMMYFNTDSDTEGTYRFTFEYRTPCKEWMTQWGLPQVKSSRRVSIVVKAPPGADAAADARQDGPELALGL